MDQGAAELMRYRIEQIFEEIKSRLEQAYPGIKLGFRLATNVPEVYGDKGRTSRVLEKLAESGALLSLGSGTVIIDAGLSGGGVLIRVRDAGGAAGTPERMRTGERFSFSFTIPAVSQA